MKKAKDKNIKIVPVKSDWKTPVQTEMAFKAAVKKIEPKIEARVISPEERISYFGKSKHYEEKSPYDVLFHMSGEYDPKAKRGDRTDISIIQENIYKEEQNRSTPVVTSHIYGHMKTNLEGRSVGIHKRMRVMDETFRRFRVNMKPEKKLPRED